LVEAAAVLATAEALAVVHQEDLGAASVVAVSQVVALAEVGKINQGVIIIKNSLVMLTSFFVLLIFKKIYLFNFFIKRLNTIFTKN
jgi:cell division protein FtsW (lipid II flippase)